MRTAAALVVLMIAACGAPTPPPTPPPRPRPAVALASPGPLIAGHAQFTCFACHAGATPEIANARCLGCHEHDGLRVRIHASRGFHATAAVRGKSCAVCHLDHKGPGYDAMGWKSIHGGERGFDHDLTGWPLAGPHAAASCRTCHTQQTAGGRPTFLAADRLCGACHENQPHGFDRRAMLACDRCHTTAAWAPPKRVLMFDHNDRQDAAVPLVGNHTNVACSACHQGGQFNSPLPHPETCENCHRTPHAGQVYAKGTCGDCHGEVSFAATMVRFEHGERTRFQLGSSHRHVACVACHTKARGDKPPSAACETCHAKRAPHHDRFKAFGSPPRCALCHAPSMEFDPQANRPPPAWKPNRFDHTAGTGWQLTGKHAQVTCRSCHRGSSPTSFERFQDGDACMSCHEHAKVHADAAHPNGQFTNAQCLSCHKR